MQFGDQCQKMQIPR